MRGIRDRPAKIAGGSGDDNHFVFPDSHLLYLLRDRGGWLGANRMDVRSVRPHRRKSSDGPALESGQRLLAGCFLVRGQKRHPIDKPSLLIVVTP